MKDEMDDPYISEEEKYFEEMFVRLMECAYPNPDRIGCPDPQILRDIAFRREVAPEILEKVLTHMMECLPCCQQARVFTGEYRQTTGQK